jgi:hypothetical protein
MCTFVSLTQAPRMQTEGAEEEQEKEEERKWAR